ncbi:hypothetical protein D9757_009925 [Collybiopsis confluens]|uniref:FAD-binding PCMH-type domain-containing protein n=1 Tax=Collybiopsis confluens TaxID=2823264 RepID=A0A8H5LWZ6_9AGAR|nr:hypothetical protein D9757_009925 [Collybiopsis confluens]
MPMLIDTAELSGLAAEGALYGIFLCLFFVCTRDLLRRRRRRKSALSWPMILAGILLILLATARFIVDCANVSVAFIHHDPRSARIAYLQDVTQPLFTTKHMILIVSLLIGDSFVNFRCWVVWGRNIWIIILPVSISFLSFGSGCYVMWAYSNLPNRTVLQESTWLKMLFGLSLVANAIATSLLAFKIWSVDRHLRGMVEVQSTSALTPVVRIIMESGMLNVAYLFAYVMAIGLGSQGLELISEMATPLTGIIFSIVILRVAHARSDDTLYTSNAPTTMPWRVAGKSTKSRDAPTVSTFPSFHGPVDSGNTQMTGNTGSTVEVEIYVQGTTTKHHDQSDVELNAINDKDVSEDGPTPSGTKPTMENLAIQGQVLTLQSGDAYNAALRRNSDLSILPAKYIVQPAVYEDIPLIIEWATSQSLEIAVKGGGAHSSTWASSNDGVVIDLGKLNKVTLAADKQTITVQGGAYWGDVYEVTSHNKVDVVGSPLWFVGVGGYTLGGGHGPLSGEHGLAIDNMLSATVVLADGRIVKTSRDEEPDLFWAIRGGGGQFGVAVEFTFKVYPSAGPIGAGMIGYPGSELAQVLKIITDWKKTQSRTERFTMNFSRPPPHFKPTIVILPTILHDTDGSRTQKALAPFSEGAVKPILNKVGLMPDMLTVSHLADAAMAAAPRSLVIRGTMISDFFPELLLAAYEKWLKFTEDNEDVRASTVLFDLTSPHRLAEVGSADTAFKNRGSNYWMAVQGRSTTHGSVKAAREFTSEIVSFVREKNAELSGRDLGWWLTLCQGDEKPEDVFGSNLPKLQRLKAKYDPGRVWSKGFVIEPSLPGPGSSQM